MMRFRNVIVLGLGGLLLLACATPQSASAWDIFKGDVAAFKTGAEKPNITQERDGPTFRYTGVVSTRDGTFDCTFVEAAGDGSPADIAAGEAKAFAAKASENGCRVRVGG